MALGVILAWGWGLGSVTAATAVRSTPVITIPTPTPQPTRPPEPHRVGPYIARLPLVLADAGGHGIDANPERFEYVVRPGDSLWTLALDFGRDLDTMSCVTSPTGIDAETLTPGQKITVPALNDLCYTVTPGDTLSSIAGAHSLTVDAIVDIPWNGFQSPPYWVVPRQRILLPGVRLPTVARTVRREASQPADKWAATIYADWPYGDGHFIWPLNGVLSQTSHPGHVALDIAAPLGSDVLAADRGTVVLAGWSPIGYGFRVVIDHGNDYVTLYAHLSDIYVQPGQVVGKGQLIGACGANGNITGPHLHFEIRDFGVLTDPLTLLP